MSIPNASHCRCAKDYSQGYHPVHSRNLDKSYLSENWCWHMVFHDGALDLSSSNTKLYTLPESFLQLSQWHGMLKVLKVKLVLCGVASIWDGPHKATIHRRLTLVRRITSFTGMKRRLYIYTHPHKYKNIYIYTYVYYHVTYVLLLLECSLLYIALPDGTTTCYTTRFHCSRVCLHTQLTA
jgi:hypothetical protein